MAARQISRQGSGISPVGRWHRGTSGALVAPMTVRLSLFLVLVATAAQAQPAPRPAPPPAQEAVPADSFKAELDQLFVKGGLTSEQAAQRAAHASPTVQRRVAELEASAASTQAAELSRVPIVSGKAAYTRLSFLPPVMLGPGFSIPFLQNTYLAEGSVALPLSDYLVRFPKLISAARLGEDAARINMHVAEVGAGQDARLTYYEWVRAKLQVLVAQRQLAQVQEIVKQFRALAEAQRLSRADLLRVESQEAEAERSLDLLQNLATLREEQLRLLIGAEPGEALSIGEDLRDDVAVPTSGQFEALVKEATGHRLEFRAIDTGIEAKEKLAEAELANKLPHLSAFAIADYARPNQRVFPQTDQFKFTWSAGVQLSWTLNDALIAHTNQNRLRAETNELRADRENLVRGTRIEVLSAVQAVQLAQNALISTRKGLIASEEGYRVRRELLNAERATAVDMVDAETDLTRARIMALNAHVDLRVALAQLAHALGQDVK
jgi:outer membrane protein